MPAITIKNHQKLKEALCTAVSEYLALDNTKGFVAFFKKPGPDGFARARYIKKTLETINDDTVALEGLFAAIILSDIYDSFMGRFANLISDKLIPQKTGVYHTEYLQEKTVCPTVTEEITRKLINPLRQNLIFNHLNSKVHYIIVRYDRNYEEFYQNLYEHRCEFDRESTLKEIANTIRNHTTPRHANTAQQHLEGINKALKVEKEQAAVVKAAAQKNEVEMGALAVK